MLEELVAEIRNGGTLEMTALAARLGISPQMLAAMLEHCRRLGLLSDYVACVDGCGGCGIQNLCIHKDHVRLWQSSNI